MNPSASSRISSWIKNLCVFGSGQMGTGVSLVAAKHLPATTVYICDVYQASLDKSRSFAESWVQKEINKGRLNSAEAEKLLQRMKHVVMSETGNHSDVVEEIFSEADFAIEAVPEVFEMKERVIKDFEKHCKFDSVFASNTSSLSITRLASISMRPEKVIGMHFMNPVPVMPLVEIIRGLSTSEETLKLTCELAKAIGKSPATSIDRPGFVANRLLMPYINEAIFALQEGVSTRDDIDKIMKLGTNMPMGPLELADFIGLDTCLAIMRVLLTDFGDSKYRPAPLLVQMVTAKKLGRKTNEGFYLY